MTGRLWPDVPLRDLTQYLPFAVWQNNQTPINNQGVCHGSLSTPGSLEQGQVGRPKASSQAEGHLGNPNPSAERSSEALKAQRDQAVASHLELVKQTEAVVGLLKTSNDFKDSLEKLFNEFRALEETYAVMQACPKLPMGKMPSECLFSDTSWPHCLKRSLQQQRNACGS